VAYYLEKVLKKRGVETDLIDLAKDSLPILEERVGHHPQLPEKIQDISIRLSEADALLFVTPEYHGSFSGALKNALDYFWAEFQKKPIGVVTVSAGKMGGINASTQLQHVILSLGAYPLPLKLLVPEIHHTFNETFEPLNEGIKKSTDKFLNEFLWFADAVYQKKSQETMAQAS
jgi:NAD(P)H-dependent FMN reductase